MSLSIIDTVGSGSTTHGLSRYKRYLGCPYYARWAEDNSDMSRAARVGILGHKLLEAWFRGETIPELFITEHTVEDEDFNKALTYAKQFQEKYDPNVFGKPLEVEKEVKVKDPNVVGIAPFTGRIDLMTRVTQQVIKDLPDQFELFDPINELEPGYWLVDHKFYSQKRSNLEEGLLGDLQFIAYPLAWNATQKRKVLGTIVNVIVMNKKMRNVLVVCPLPDYNKVRKLHNAMNIIHQRMTAPELEKNPMHCESYFGSCPVKRAGDCCGY